MNDMFYLVAGKVRGKKKLQMCKELISTIWLG